MLRLRTLTAATAIALAGSAFAQDSGQSADTVVATVNGTDITLGHMIALRARLPQQYQTLDDQVLFDGILEQLTQQTALTDQADGLSKRGELTIENERRALLAAEVIERLAADAVTEEQLQAAYDAEFGDVPPATEYNASHILVETEEEAQTLIEELEGGADFAELAMQNSTGPSGPSGGELGWFGPGAMVGPFDEAVQAMEVGAIAGPVQTQFGWHVIKLNDAREQSAPTLDEVRADLETELRRQAVEGLAASAVEDAEVTRSETAFDPAIIRDDALLD